MKSSNWATLRAEIKQAGQINFFDTLPAIVSVFIFYSLPKFSNEAIGLNVWLASILALSFAAGTWRTLNTDGRSRFVVNVLFGLAIGFGCSSLVATVFASWGEARPAFHWNIAFLCMYAYVAPCFMVTLYEGLQDWRPHPNEIVLRRLRTIVLGFAIALVFLLPAIFVIFR